MKDVEAKAQEFFGTFAEQLKVTEDLRGKGVPEERLSDPSFGLGEMAPMVRLLYTVLERHALLKAMSTGCTAGEESAPAPSAADLEDGRTGVGCSWNKTSSTFDFWLHYQIRPTLKPKP